MTQEQLRISAQGAKVSRSATCGGFKDQILVVSCCSYQTKYLNVRYSNHILVVRNKAVGMDKLWYNSGMKVQTSIIDFLNAGSISDNFVIAQCN